MAGTVGTWSRLSGVHRGSSATLIGSLDGLAFDGPAMAGWLERVRLELILPIRSMREPDAPEWPPRTGELRGLPGGSLVRARAAYRDQDVPGSRDAARNWSKILAGLDSGQVDEVDLEVDFLDADGSVPWAGHNMGLTLRPLVPSAMTQVTFSVEASDLGGRVPGAVQTALVGLLSDAAIRFGVGSGFIALNRGDDLLTIHERQAGLGEYVPLRTEVPPVRGCEWGTYLGPAHVRTLGGGDRIKRAAPVVRVAELRGDPQSTLFLQLTPDVNFVPRPARDELCRYLRPVLREQEQHPSSGGLDGGGTAIDEAHFVGERLAGQAIPSGNATPGSDPPSRDHARSAPGAPPDRRPVGFPVEYDIDGPMDPLFFTAFLSREISAEEEAALRLAVEAWPDLELEPDDHISFVSSPWIGFDEDVGGWVAHWHADAAVATLRTIGEALAALDRALQALGLIRRLIVSTRPPWD